MVDHKQEEQKDAQFPEKDEKKALTTQEFQARIMATQQQAMTLNQMFGEIGGVTPDATALKFDRDQDGAVEETEIDAAQIRLIMASVIDLDDPENKLALGKMAYLANAFAAYVIQKTLAGHNDLASEDFVGRPYKIMPPIPGISDQTVAQFSSFKTNDPTELSQYLQNGINEAFRDVEGDEVLAKAYKSFTTLIDQVAASQRLAGQGLEADQILFQLLESKVIFSALTRDQIFAESMNAYKEGERLGDNTLLSRLQNAISMMDKAEQNLPQHMRAPKFIIDQNGQRLDYSLMPLAFDRETNAIVVADHVKKQIHPVTRGELISALKTKENPELLSLTASIIAIDAVKKFANTEQDIGEIYDVIVDTPELVEEVWGAFQGEEELVTLMKDVKPDQMGYYPYPMKVETHTPNPDAKATALFGALKTDGMAMLSTVSDIEKTILAPLTEELKSDVVASARLGGVKQGLEQNASMAQYMMKVVRTALTTPYDKESLQNMAQEDGDYAEVLEKMTTLQAEHDEKVESYQDELKRKNHINDIVLARGRQSEKAYEAWKTIHALPREQQAASQLRAFVPSVASDVPANAVTSAANDHDFIELALDSWKTARMADVKNTLGDLSPMEEALMHYTLDAAYDSMRYVVMAELAAYDPTVIMRHQKEVYFKHLDQAAAIYKKNGGVEPLQNLDSHLAHWFGWYDKDCDRNLINMVSYNTPDGSQASEHHHYTFYFCMADFFNNATVLAKSNALDNVGLSGLANRLMRRDNPHRLTREIAQAIASKDLSKLDIDQDRFDQIIERSTHVANRPADTGQIHDGDTSLLSGRYVRWKVR